MKRTAAAEGVGLRLALEGFAVGEVLDPMAEGVERDKGSTKKKMRFEEL